MRLAVLLLASASLLTGCGDVSNSEHWDAEAAKAERREQAARVQYKAAIDYLWRVQVVRVCHSQYIVQGSDGRRWLSSYRNPGEGWMDERMNTSNQNPWQVVAPVAPDVPLKDLCT